MIRIRPVLISKVHRGPMIVWSWCRKFMVLSMSPHPVESCHRPENVRGTGEVALFLGGKNTTWDNPSRGIQRIDLLRYGVVLFILILGGMSNHPLWAAADARELFKEGITSFQEGRIEEAIQYLEKSIEMDSNFAPAFFFLGMAYKTANADEGTIIWYFKNAVQIDPNYAEAYENLGKAYYGLGDFERAIENCKKAISLKPGLIGSNLSLAWVYLLGKSNPRQAIYYFKEVLKTHDLANAHYGLGMAYFMNNESPLVLEQITKLKELKENSLAVHLENMIRGHDYIPPHDQSQPLVNIQPPAEPSAASPARIQGRAQLQGQAQMRGTLNPAGQGSSDMDVRMQGQLLDPNAPLPYGQNPIPYGQNPTQTRKRKPSPNPGRARVEAQVNRQISVQPSGGP